MDSLNDRSSPVEVRLHKNRLRITATVVHEDEGTEQLEVTSVKMRGAQKVITAQLRDLGYQPSGRWQPANGNHSVRAFVHRGE